MAIFEVVTTVLLTIVSISETVVTLVLPTEFFVLAVDFIVADWAIDKAMGSAFVIVVVFGDFVVDSYSIVATERLSVDVVVGTVAVCNTVDVPVPVVEHPLTRAWTTKRVENLILFLNKNELL